MIRIQKMVTLARDEIERQRHPERELAKRVRLGFASVDADLTLELGSLVTVGGDTNVGKSTFLNLLAMNMALAGKRVLHFSLEDGEREVARRALGLMGHVPPKLLERYDVPPAMLDEAERRLDAMPDITWAQIIGEKSLEKMIAVTKKAAGDGGVDVLIIDYLQEVHGPQRENFRLSITASVDAMQEATRDLDVLILLGSQIARPENRSETFEPNKHHLKEAGAIGERSDKILMLYRESWDQGAPTILKCAKDKGGSATGKKWKLYYNANTGALFDA